MAEYGQKRNSNRLSRMATAFLIAFAVVIAIRYWSPEGFPRHTGVHTMEFTDDVRKLMDQHERRGMTRDEIVTELEILLDVLREEEADRDARDAAEGGD